MATANVQIAEWLGVPTPASDSDVLRLVEGRLSPSVIACLDALGLERSEINATVIPSRTLQHRRVRQEDLTVEESDRVLRVLRVLAATEDVYGNRNRALEWLRRPNPRLEDRAPLSLLKTDTGSRMVEELLIQIDEGMFL